MNNSYLFPAFPGKKNQLLQRVSRIVSHQNLSLLPAEKILFLAGIVLLIAIFSISTHVLPGNTITKSEQTIHKRNSNFQEEQNTIAKAEALAQVESPKRTIEQHWPGKSTNSEKNISQKPTQAELVNKHHENELTAALTTKEKMELDRRQAKLDQQKANIEREIATKEMQQAQIQKLLAEKDAQRADANRQQSELAIIQAKLEMEKSQQSQVKKNLNQGLKTFNNGVW